MVKWLFGFLSMAWQDLQLGAALLVDFLFRCVEWLKTTFPAPGVRKVTSLSSSAWAEKTPQLSAARKKMVDRKLMVVPPRLA
jgi:hypothetical protein